MTPRGEVTDAPARRLGSYTSGRPGPTLLVVGGLHGNEPAGVAAARRVLGDLDRRAPPLRGELIALTGNRVALEKGRRYLQRDLNRLWALRNVEAITRRASGENGPDEQALADLAGEIQDAAQGTRSGLVVLDLHTTSGHSPPFLVMSDTLRNRPIAFSLKLPVVLGLEESVDGTLLEYLTEQGHRAVLVEGGAHADPRSVDLHAAAIWQVLVAAGLLDADAVPDFARHRRLLDEAGAGLPRVLELRHRHPIEPGDRFEMQPGLRGFMAVRKGQLLATDRNGEVRAPEAGLLLMPLYQKQGSDGFFLIRPVSRFWLLLSSLLRRMRLQYALLLLPGVRRHPDRLFALRVDPKVARWFLVEIFHLFGYRCRRREMDHFIFSRRRP